jgi:hypothetical protein
MTLIKREARAYRGLTRMSADQKNIFTQRRGDAEKSKTLKHGGTETENLVIE